MSDMLDAALHYARRGWAVFPCRGKKPWIAKKDGGQGFKDATTDVGQIKRWWGKWPTANIGLATGKISGVFVLDIDALKGGQDSLDELVNTYSPLPDTVQSITHGGYHFYFNATNQNIPPSSEKLGPGLDIRGDGGYVILPPSRHPKGGNYEWELSSHPDDTLVADAPTWLIALIEETHTNNGHYQRRKDINPVPLHFITDGCPWIRHCHTDAQTLSEPTWYGAIGILARCEDGERIAHEWSTPYPKYSYREAQTKIEHSLLAAGPATCQHIRAHLDGERFCAGCEHWGKIKSPISLANAAVKQSRSITQMWQQTTRDSSLQPWRESLLTKKNGDPTNNVTNIGLILANHPNWQGKFWLDSIRNVPMVEDEPLTDEKVIYIAQWLGLNERLAISATRPVEQCVVALCQKNPKDLLQHWLNELPPWDGTERLDYWLHDVGGIQNDAYGMAISRILPLSMVARVMEPGCLYRFVVILEGPENTGKSSLVRALAGPEWYVEVSTGLDNKEAHMIIQGAWVAELAELDSLTRTEETRLKAFITQRVDTWIPKYSNNRRSLPRRTVFVGTTNDESYLKGQTGNTRFLPIKTNVCDVEAFCHMREQIFAEAFHVYNESPFTWWSLNQEAIEQAETERENRRIINVYEDELGEWLDARPPSIRDEVTWQEIASGFLRLENPHAWKDKSLQMQIAQALKVLGWRPDIIWRNGKTRRVWARKHKTQDFLWDVMGT